MEVIQGHKADFQVYYTKVERNGPSAKKGLSTEAVAKHGMLSQPNTETCPPPLSYSFH